MALTLEHDRRKRIEADKKRWKAEVKAKAAQERADLLSGIKVEALNVARVSAKSSHLVPHDALDSAEFETLTTDQKLDILSDYADRLLALGIRLSAEWGDNEGAREKLKEIEDKINAVGEMIIEIELAGIRPDVPEDERLLPAPPSPSVGKAIAYEYTEADVADKVKSIIQERLNTK